MSGDEMHELGERARRREAEREAYLASDEAAELIAPPSAEERQRLLRAVLPPARAGAQTARRSPFCSTAPFTTKRSPGLSDSFSGIRSSRPGTCPGTCRSLDLAEGPV